MTEVSKNSLLWQRGAVLRAMPFADALMIQGANHMVCW